MSRRISSAEMLLAVAMLAVLGEPHAEAGLLIDTVTVGNPSNPGDARYPDGGVPSFGSVGYTYNIGQYEVTAGEYTAFLNAVAATDTYGLYNTSMWLGNSGCKIQRSGSSGSYTYSVAADWANRPVNYVSWGDSARFTNWLQNGQPTGAQGPGATEDGSYLLNGAMENGDLMAVERAPGATWALPSEDEWYKAAYHKNDGGTGNYWSYPTGADSNPSNDLIGLDPGNNANFYQNGDTIGAPYWRTPVGEFENSQSPYGTFDMGGNVWEWTDTVVVLSRGLRGGSFDTGGVSALHASHRTLSTGYALTNESNDVGFRVSVVPEPTTISLLAAGGLILTSRRREQTRK